MGTAPTLADHDHNLIRWVRNQPKNGTVRWSTAHLDEETPFALSWIDVHFHGDRPLEMNWAVTIESDASIRDSGDDGSLASWQILVPYDGELRMRFDNADAQGIPDHVEVRSSRSVVDITSYAHRPWKMRDETWQREMFWNHHHQVEDVTINDVVYPAISAREGNTVITPVWTPAGVTAALLRWADSVCEREDLQFVYSPDEPPCESYQQALEALDALTDENGDIDTSKTVRLDDVT